MKVKPIDKRKKKNIYCDHCDHYNKSGSSNYKEWSCACESSKHYLMHREYYHRCKCFEWRKDAVYIE